MSLQVHQFQCLSDNYGFLINDPESGDTASVDSPDASAINDALAEKHWNLTHILNTHLHFDHAGGATMLNSDDLLIPTFPNAKYFISKRNWDAGLNPSPRDSAIVFTLPNSS